MWNHRGTTNIETQAISNRRSSPLYSLGAIDRIFQSNMTVKQSNYDQFLTPELQSNMSRRSPDPMVEIVAEIQIAWFLIMEGNLAITFPWTHVKQQPGVDLCSTLCGVHNLWFRAR